MSANAVRLGGRSISQQSELPPVVPNASWLDRGRAILKSEIQALCELERRLDESFCKAVEILRNCEGKIVVSGVGKAGIVGQKFSASLSSTGSASHFLHPTEAVHGDLGAVTERDVLVFFSYSGETEELIRLVAVAANATGHQEKIADSPATPSRPRTIALTGTADSTLAKCCDLTIPLGRYGEACALGLAPSTSTTLMIALGDALALVLSEVKGFTAERFGDFHPGGSLGRKLKPVTEVMRPLEDCRLANQCRTIREVFIQISRPGRRSGAIMLTDDDGLLTGIFTDSDLARILEQQRDDRLDAPVSEAMSRQFQTIASTALMPTAVELMAKYKISELPVVDASGLPVGMVDVTDIVEFQQVSKPDSNVVGQEEMQSRAGEHTKRSSSMHTDSRQPVSAKQPKDIALPAILSLLEFQKEMRQK